MDIEPPHLRPECHSEPQPGETGDGTLASIELEVDGCVQVRGGYRSFRIPTGRTARASLAPVLLTKRAPIVSMIARVWRGWTDPANADEYEYLLREEILPEIASTTSSGFEGGDVFRRQTEEEVEFMTILWFETMDDVRAFVGEEPRTAHVPEEARRLLHRYEDETRHYEHRGQTRS